MPTLSSVFPSTEGAWEDMLNLLLNAIIIKSIQPKLNPKKQVNVANYFLPKALHPGWGCLHNRISSEGAAWAGAKDPP